MKNIKFKLSGVFINGVVKKEKSILPCDQKEEYHFFFKFKVVCLPLYTFLA